jgi:hypothetical protein
MNGRWRLWGAVAVAAVLLSPAAALAGSDYSDKPFSVRLPPAFVRFTEVTAGGGGTAASRTSSAINPASSGWTELPFKLRLTAAPYYSYIGFENDNVLHLFGESLTWDSGACGVFQPTLAQIRSNRHTDRRQLVFDYRVDTFQLMWGKRFDDVAVGATFNFNLAEIVQKLGPIRVAKSNAESYRFRVGGLWAPTKKWLTGLVVEYGFAPYRSTALGFGPQGQPMTVKTTGCPQQLLVRPGVSYAYADHSMVYLDYAYGRFADDDGYYLNSHRFSAGVDHQLLKWLFVRGGASVDIRGNAGLTAGVGVHLSRHCGLEFGYQYDVLPELRSEFGRSHMFQFVFSLRM